ncbi:helix-turn-helix transcriptional regulator [Mycolicibacterium sphagni]|nr:helix-turn-helix domain-containing protein [Mycolicibacterium sphagni]
MSARLAQLLTTADMTRLFGVHRRTIYNWRRSGIIPAPKRIGHYLYWQQADVLAFLQNRGAS